MLRDWTRTHPHQLHESATARHVTPGATLRHIVVAENDAPVRELVQKILTQQGFRVTTALSPSALIAALAREQVDLIVADVHLQESEGTSLLADLRTTGVTTPVLFISGDHDLNLVERALGVPNAAFLPKPFTPQELITAVHAHLPRL